jgi:single-strand DNA-binding protein
MNYMMSIVLLSSLCKGNIMSSLNKVILVGRLGANPDIRYFSNGDAVCHFSIATSSKWRDKETGALREITEWHRIVLYRQLAETAAEFLKKGSFVCIEGRLRSRQWTDREGNPRQTTEVEARRMQMLGSGRIGVQQAAEPATEVDAAPADAASVEHAAV